MRNLRLALEGVAKPDSPGWWYDYTFGFIVNHVAFGMNLAKSRLWPGWFQKDWPSMDEISAAVLDLAPAELPLDAQRFRETYPQVLARWPRDAALTKTVLGAMMGDRAMRMRAAHKVMNLHWPNDAATQRVFALEKEFRALPAPTTLGRMTGYRRAEDVYRYVVLRTLGEEAFGVSQDAAARIVLGNAALEPR